MVAAAAHAEAVQVQAEARGQAGNGGALAQAAAGSGRAGGTLAAATPACTSDWEGGALARHIAATPCSFIEPEAFFVSWQGVLTLAYSGFPPALLDLKARLVAAHPALPEEKSGSRWPKTSLGCLKDGAQALSQSQLDTLLRICREESAAAWGSEVLQQPAAAAAQGPLRLRVACLAHCVFEARCLERLLACQLMPCAPALDPSPPSAEARAAVAGVLAEAEHPEYLDDVRRPGGRESHYRGPHIGATLVIPLAACAPPSSVTAAGPSDGGGSDAVLQGGGGAGQGDAAAVGRLLAAVARFRWRVDAELPGLYTWFSDDSLHVTLRAVKN